MPDRHVREQLATFSLEKEALSRYFQQIEIEHFIQPIFAWFEETRFDIQLVQLLGTPLQVRLTMDDSTIVERLSSQTESDFH